MIYYLMHRPPPSYPIPPPSFTPHFLHPLNSTELPLFRKFGESNQTDYASGCRYWFSIQQTDPNHAQAKAALAYYVKTEQAGLSLGNLLLGRAYEDGYGTSVDPAKSMENYRKAAERCDPDGIFLYALALSQNGNATEAQKHIQKAAECGHVLSMVWLGEIIMSMNNSTEQLKKGFEWLEKAEKRGCRKASGTEQRRGCIEVRIILAERKIRAEGTERSGLEAARWLNEAAKSSDVRGREDVRERFWKTVAAFCEVLDDVSLERKIRYMQYAKELGQPCEEKNFSEQ